MKKKIASRIMKKKACVSVHLRLFVLLCFVGTLMWSCLSLLAHATEESMTVMKSEDAKARDRKIALMIQSHIIKDTMDEDPAVRCQALTALGQWYYFCMSSAMIKPARQPIVDALLRDKDKQVRCTALLILADLPEKRTRKLIERYPSRGIARIFQQIVATDRDRDLRRIAAVSLLNWGVLDKHKEKIWQYTLEMLQHPDPNYQDYALKALWHTAFYCKDRFYNKEQVDLYKLHPSVRARIKEMARTLTPSHALIKTVSYIWQGRWQGRDTPLLKWLKDDDYKLRRTSALALENYSLKDDDVTAALLDMLRGDSSIKVRAAAAKAISGPSRRWLSATDYREFDKRKFSQETQKVVWSALVEVARKDAAPEVRAAALLSLVNLEEEDASTWDLFTDAMRDENMLVRKTAVLRGWHRQGDVVAELYDTLRSDSGVKVKAAAAKALLLFPNKWTITDPLRNTFPPKMQKIVWKTLAEAARNDATPEVRAAALLSLANLHEGDASAWDLFTDVMLDENMLVCKTAVWGVGDAIYLQFNEVIQAALMHVAYSCDDVHLRVSAIESLLLFNYWDENIHSFIMDMLKRHPEDTIGLLYGYAQMGPHSRQKLREEFQATKNEQMKLYLSMVLVEYGFSDGEYIEHIVHAGLKDEKFASYCIQLLGCSGYREPFVIDALLAKLRESLARIEPYKATGANLYPATNRGGYVCMSREGEYRIRFCMEALMRLDGYNADFTALLPQLMYLSGMNGVSEVAFRYTNPFHWTGMNTINHSIRDISRSLRRGHW